MCKKKSVLWIIVFAVLIIIPPVLYPIIGKYVDTENYENRSTAEKPKLAINTLKNYPEEYEDYYNDTLPFRNYLIRLNSYIDYYVFNQSSSEKVALGEEGWLFYRGTSTDTSPIKDSLGYFSFTEEQLETIADNLIATAEVLEDKDIEFILFIAPNKETIYKEYLPGYYSVQNDVTRADQLVKYLQENTDIRVIYPKTELLEQKEAYPDILLYDKLDTHWNYAGSYIGTKNLAAELGIEMPDLNVLQLDEVISSTGDLTNMLNMEIKNGNIDYDISGEGIYFREDVEMEDINEFISENESADERKIFISRDSFSTAMAPFLSELFAESKFVKRSAFEESQIYEFGADIFVYEVVERSIGGLVGFKLSGEG